MYWNRLFLLSTKSKHANCQLDDSRPGPTISLAPENSASKDLEASPDPQFVGLSPRSVSRQRSFAAHTLRSSTCPWFRGSSTHRLPFPPQKRRGLEPRQLEKPRLPFPSGRTSPRHQSPERPNRCAFGRSQRPVVQNEIETVFSTLPPFFTRLRIGTRISIEFGIGNYRQFLKKVLRMRYRSVDPAMTSETERLAGQPRNWRIFQLSRPEIHRLDFS